MRKRKVGSERGEARQIYRSRHPAGNMIVTPNLAPSAPSTPSWAVSGVGAPGRDAAIPAQRAIQNPTPYGTAVHFFLTRNYAPSTALYILYCTVQFTRVVRRMGR